MFVVFHRCMASTVFIERLRCDRTMLSILKTGTGTKSWMFPLKTPTLVKQSEYMEKSYVPTLDCVAPFAFIEAAESVVSSSKRSCCWSSKDRLCFSGLPRKASHACSGSLLLSSSSDGSASGSELGVPLSWVPSELTGKAVLPVTSSGLPSSSGSSKPSSPSCWPRTPPKASKAASNRYSGGVVLEFRRSERNSIFKAENVRKSRIL